MGICNVTFVAYGWPVYTLDINTCMYTIEFYIQAWTLMGALYSYAIEVRKTDDIAPAYTTCDIIPLYYASAKQYYMYMC